MRPGESVLIHAAAGSVGTADRAAYAAQFGYDQLLLREEFPAKLGDERPDVILDPVGRP